MFCGLQTYKGSTIYVRIFVHRLHPTSRRLSRSPTLKRLRALEVHLQQHLRARRLIHHLLKILGLHHPLAHRLFQNQLDPFKVLIHLTFNLFEAHTFRSFYIYFDLFCLNSFNIRELSFSLNYSEAYVHTQQRHTLFH